jgi:hypothetical protein
MLTDKNGKSSPADTFTRVTNGINYLDSSSASQPRSEPVIYTPESTAEALANPPTKRRRAKRTEEERIDYLQSDPYVAQFEAFRVLCGSCDKWIRLRPNSTYCSIPWDAHRKSCLSKKMCESLIFYFSPSSSNHRRTHIFLQKQQKRVRPGRAERSLLERS